MMKYILNASLLVSLAALTVAGPIETTPRNPSYNAKLRSLTPSIAKRGTCSPTGEGVCNLGVTSTTSISTTTGEANGDTYHTVQIFDRYCTEIGRLDNPAIGSCIFSQLPYAVCMDALSSDIVFPAISFRYGAGSFSNCACSDDSFDGNPYSTCQCAFDC